MFGAFTHGEESYSAYPIPLGEVRTTLTGGVTAIGAVASLTVQFGTTGFITGQTMILVQGDLPTWIPVKDYGNAAGGGGGLPSGGFPDGNWTDVIT